METKRIYFKNLDIIRLAAAMSVVFAHGFDAWKVYFIEYRFSKEYVADYFSGSFLYFERFFGNLGIGVEVFFFISGFLITYILLVEKERTGSISFWRFFVRRSLRIWPLYFLLVALGPIISDWMHYGNPDYLSICFFYANFEVIQSGQWQFPFAHYWSIALEEQYYLVWPPIMALLKKKHLPYIMVALIIVSIASRIYFFYFSQNTYFNLYLNTLSRMDTLLIGGLIAFKYHAKPFQFSLPKGVNFLLLLSLLGSFCFIDYNDWSSIFLVVFKKYLYLLIFGLIIFDYLFNPKYAKSNFIKRPLTYLGKISYGIYMYHNILVIIVIKEILLNNKLFSGVTFTIVYLSSVIVISIISFELYEKWFLRLKERFSVVQTRKF
jgi:peptidoglycan/LPS O-acetylase OafA/YrhL